VQVAGDHVEPEGDATDSSQSLLTRSVPINGPVGREAGIVAVNCTVAVLPCQGIDWTAGASTSCPCDSHCRQIPNEGEVLLEAVDELLIGSDHLDGLPLSQRNLQAVVKPSTKL
jgi:hypothetical protein